MGLYGKYHNQKSSPDISNFTFFNNPDSYIVYYAADDLCVTVVFGETYINPKP